MRYKSIGEILSRRGVRLVVVQYPLRDIMPLKMLMHQWPDTLFADNKVPFERVITPENFFEYFADSEGGDFGHATAKGNRLLAENIAAVIRNEMEKGNFAIGEK